ncbi:hypothetical protein QMO14_30225 [Variovorax sp. CAN2819]|uniref:hypothetical protein n=1 Tax=Variovorax sp. CAN15 TaxID=3046727 RepID=UPI0026496980|nr:hypothetical protein [Variovorax sp. CAN15]MDN6887858.1 hypothetical protein [Variovorax sp. CAN15]
MAKTFMLGCLRQDKRKFMASQVSYKAGDGAARQRFELNVQALGMPGIRSKRESTFDGYRVLDIEARNENSCSFMRYVLVEPTQIAMIVEAPLAECDDLAADSRVFFSSLRVRP